MIHRKDAESITDANKKAYIKEKALEYVPVCFKKIREAANNMKNEAHLTIEGPQFIPEIISELAKVMKESGYSTTMDDGGNNRKFFHIYWRDLTEKEKRFEI